MIHHNDYYRKGGGEETHSIARPYLIQGTHIPYMSFIPYSMRSNTS